ncbi:BspA family leucine-rich repeat surface protein [Mycoplasmopsis agalactiae]|uniref:BspA family leucine-rich repeat surface protein n=1 Tax=Mycoplasmopsis agalactiae TaxID=2110 RepID=UPI001F905329|nr:BspA family leucine-rich repeat surface protein [Mycoplasmopsis agalactiae]MCE6061690.1 BspA family leucine-rich repeat surface protein [Mycoplasmopsis agalactiae]
MKKSKFLILGSLASLSAIPLVAARCGTSAKSEETNKNKLEKDEITGELTNNNDKNTNADSNDGKNNTDTSNNDSSTETINNEMNNSSNPNNNESNNGVQGDEPKVETEVAPETSESSNSSSNNNGGNYSINNHPNGMSSDAPASTPGEEAKLKKELEDVEKVKKIVDEHKDAFAAFHTQGDFLDQIAVYANDEGISELKLQKDSEKDTKLVVDKDGSGKKNKLSLKLGSQDFQVELGRVLENAVVTKYYVKDEPSKILDNFSERGTHNIEANWGYQMRDKIVVITQLGYRLDSNKLKLTGIGKKTIKVPKHLPLKVESLSYSFYNLQSENIENIDEWDVKNITNAEGAFLDAKSFSQDLSKWKINKNGSKLKSIFKGASKMGKHLDNIAKSWGVDKSILTG